MLDHASDDHFEVATKLKHSFYVDNCITGVFNKQEMENFILISQQVMLKGCFNLRCWESNFANPHISKSSGETNVLGLTWDLDKDTLKCKVPHEKLGTFENMTKRSVLSIIQQLFDPIGILSAATLLPKLWLQETWKMKLSWDELFPDELCNKFRKWLNQISCLDNIEILRYAEISNNSELHVFVDACKTSYAACVFVRTDSALGTRICLLRAKSRVAPVKAISMPRLELLACCIGARLANSIRIALDLPDIKTTYWTDSMVALYWIKNYGEWSVFVSNRVKEINKITPQGNWRHVPGTLNPADLISRGCLPKQLLDSEWIKGPSWLSKSCETWPSTEIVCKKEDLDSERRKTKISCVNVTEESVPWYLTKFSNYHSIIRLVAWILRFINNSRTSAENRQFHELSVLEIETAEKALIRLVQRTYFPTPDAVPIVHTFKDNEGIIRVKTAITERNDYPSFVAPILLPSECLLTKRLIEYFHRKNCHAGVQILLSIIREEYWILRARKSIRNVIKNCVRCQRYNAKAAISEPVALPADRVKDANIFQVIGIDLAGPLYLRNGEKGWIILFTCAIFRATHLDIVTSLSTETFLLALRRFIARRGRPDTIYSDNGTNFKGAFRELQKLNWNKIMRETEIERIKWKFNPPTAAWWGGWWERLVRVIKELLRRSLGKTTLTYEELCTILCEIEAIINSRPLTYVSEDSQDLIPLTPAMFLTQNSSFDVTDLQSSEFSNFQRRVRYRQKILEDIRSRFRKEYLSQLVQKRPKGKTREYVIGEVVLVEDPNKKRVYWPLAKVIEVIMGKDGKVRTLKLKCNNSIIIRPVQRVFPLEIQPDPSDVCFKHLRATVVPDSSVPVTTDSPVPVVPGTPVPVVPDAPIPSPRRIVPDDELKGYVTRYGRKISAPKHLNS